MTDRPPAIEWYRQLTRAQAGLGRRLAFKRASSAQPDVDAKRAAADRHNSAPAQVARAAKRAARMRLVKGRAK